MKREIYETLEQYMLSCMEDSAHDAQHIYRVLYNALLIAKEEEGVDHDVLIAACLLHDIGRKEQFADPALCHAAVGSEKARVFLLQHGFAEDFADRVAHCILAHRFRKANPPQSIEAKILFDADKLDATGAIGIARTLQFKADTKSAIYTLRPDGTVSNGEEEEGSSFFREYQFKLKKLYDRFYTAAGERMARERERIAQDYYESLYREVSHGYTDGARQLAGMLEE
jgi:uncharacterized protein